jgi:hypothetical protein
MDFRVKEWFRIGKIHQLVAGLTAKRMINGISK